MAVGHSVESAGSAAETDKLLDQTAGRFPQVEARRRAGKFLLDEAGVPADIDSSPSPALAAGILTRPPRAWVPARWLS